MSAFFALVVFLSTPSARRATRVRGLLQFYGAFLSTPSARRATIKIAFITFSTGLFLSTPSARRATPQLGTLCLTMCDFYPRPPRGGRRDSR